MAGAVELLDGPTVRTTAFRGPIILPQSSPPTEKNYMPRKAGSKVVDGKVIPPESTPAPAPTPEAEPKKETAPAEEKKPFQPFVPTGEVSPGRSSAKPRISITVNDDGVLDMSAARIETIDRVKAFFRNPKNQELLGLNVDASQIISEDDVHNMLDAIGTVETLLATVAMKIDPDIAQHFIPFTPKEKELITPSAQAVIKKHAGSLTAYLNWKDEIMLGIIMMTMTRAKFDACKKSMANRYSVVEGEIKKPTVENVATVDPDATITGVDPSRTN